MKIFKFPLKSVISLPLCVIFLCSLRDDKYMTSLKIGDFSRLPTPLIQLRSKFFHLLVLGRPISNEPLPSPNYNQSAKRKHNPRMTTACFQFFPSGRLLFSLYQLINLIWLPIDFYPFSWSHSCPQSYFEQVKTSFSASSYSEKMCWGSSLSWILTIYFFVALYSCVCSCPKI